MKKLFYLGIAPALIGTAAFSNISSNIRENVHEKIKNSQEYSNLNTAFFGAKWFADRKDLALIPLYGIGFTAEFIKKMERAQSAFRNFYLAHSHKFANLNSFNAINNKLYAAAGLLNPILSFLNAKEMAKTFYTYFVPAYESVAKLIG